MTSTPCSEGLRYIAQKVLKGHGLHLVCRALQPKASKILTFD